MPIIPQTPDASIEAWLEEQTERLRKAIIRQLEYVGERCLTAARSTNSYTDRTGNLRSSIGYVLVVDGRIRTESGFEQVSQGSEGISEGRAFARRLAAGFPQGITLLLVAGMNYARYVADKGYDVLDSAELLAERLVPVMLAQLGLK